MPWSCSDSLQYTVDNAILHSVSEPVTPGEDINDLVGKLIYGVKLLRGQGLAAPQIGVLKRVAVARQGNYLKIMVNPEITDHGRDIETKPEGCLSSTGYVVHVPRWRIIDLQYEDFPSRKLVRLTLKGNDARVAQHEIDHLNGKLIVDALHSSP